MEKRVFIGSDLSGFTLKEAVKEFLLSEDYEVEDIGTLTEEEPFPFYTVAKKGAEKIQNKEYERGILICGTGMGMSIVSNKHEGVHGAACETVYTAEKARAINDANVLCMGGWVVAPVTGVAMTKTFLETKFTQNLEDWRAKRLHVAREDVRDIEKNSFHK